MQKFCESRAQSTRFPELKPFKLQNISIPGPPNLCPFATLTPTIVNLPFNPPKPALPTKKLIEPPSTPTDTHETTVSLLAQNVWRFTTFSLTFIPFSLLNPPPAPTRHNTKQNHQPQPLLCCVFWPPSFLTDFFFNFLKIQVKMLFLEIFEIYAVRSLSTYMHTYIVQPPPGF